MALLNLQGTATCILLAKDGARVTFGEGVQMGETLQGKAALPGQSDSSSYRVTGSFEKPRKLLFHLKL